MLGAWDLKSPGEQSPGLSFVDKRFKISNLDLIRDMVDLIETLGEFS